MVLVMVRLVRRLTGSTLLGGVAGLLLCFDGLQLVLSRLALLDIYVRVLPAVRGLLPGRRPRLGAGPDGPQSCAPTSSAVGTGRPVVATVAAGGRA